MANNQALNFDQHGHLRVVKDAFEKGVALNTNCSILSGEIFAAASSFPIVLMKDDATNRFILSIIFCLQSDKNNFYSNGNWLAPYVPLNLRREPFSLYVYENDEQDSASVVINLDSELIRSDEGELIFQNDGQPTAYLIDKLNILETLKRGQDTTQSFVEHLLRLGLVKPLKIKLTHVDKVRWVSGIYGIDIETLNQGNEALIVELAKLGILEDCLMMKASFSQLGRLVWMENQQSDNPIENYSIVV